MSKSVLYLATVILVLLLACSAGSEEALGEFGGTSAVKRGSLQSGEDAALGLPAATAAPAAAPSAAFAVNESDGGSQVGANALETAQRKVISSASVSIEVEDVQEAVTGVRTIAEGLGGFVEQLSSSGEPEHERAAMTVRVPQGQFFPAMERIEALGTVQNRNVGSEDVSEQFIDLEARLKSSLREEESLLSLLEKAATVSEVLAIERELTRVRSEVERLQGRLNFLERRVDLATISVSLFPPEQELAEPLSAALIIRVPDVGAAVAEVKGLVGTLDGVVDGVFLSQRGGREEADLSLRVYAGQFQRAMDFLEGRGEVRSKEVREGTAPSDGGAVESEKPDARIDLSLVAEADSNAGLIAAIAAPLGVVWLAAILGALFFFVYRAGRRRGTD